LKNFIPSTIPKIAATAALILLFLTVGRWWFAGRDISRFIVCGERCTDSAALPTPLEVLPQSHGYDGQFFARLAFAPFDKRKTAHGITLDSPAYRQQRILYPLLAWLTAAGDPARVPWTMVLINFCALIGIAVISALILRAYAMHPGYGILVMLSSGFILSFGRNLAEPLSGFLTISALYFFLQHRLAGCAVLASCSVLTREPSLITFAALGLTTMWDRLQGQRKTEDFQFLWLLLPLIIFLGWQTYLTNLWGHPPFLSGPSLNPWPLKDFFIQLARHPYLTKPFEASVLILYLAWHLWLALQVLISCSKRLRDHNSAQRKNLAAIRLAWTFWTLFATCLPLCIWEDDWGFTRILAEWSLLGWLCLFTARQKPQKSFILFTLFLASGSLLRLWLRP